MDELSYLLTIVPLIGLAFAMCAVAVKVVLMMKSSLISYLYRYI